MKRYAVPCLVVIFTLIYFAFASNHWYDLPVIAFDICAFLLWWDRVYLRNHTMPRRRH